MPETTIEKLTQQLVGLTDKEFEQLAQQADVATVQQDGASFEGFMAFSRLMMHTPGEGVIEPALHHQKWIKATLEHNRVLILAPPESAKTTIMSVLFTCFWIAKHPTLRAVVVCVSDDLAEKIVGLITTYIEHHPAFKLCFPHIVADKKRGWGFDKGFFVKRNDVTYGEWTTERGDNKDPTLVGVGYGNRSIIGKRVDFFVVDDMIDENNSASEAELEKAKSIFRKTISSRVTKTGKMVVIGTPWRDDDVYAYALSTGLYQNFITPAWTKNKAGELVSYWPSQWPISRLKDKQTELGERDFRLMYLMDLEANKGTILKEEWLHPYFRSYEVDPMWPLYYGIDFAVKSSDLGISRSHGRRNTRSNFAIAKIRAAPFGLVLVDGWVGTISLFEAIEKIKSWSEAEFPKKIQVETWGTGELFLQMLIKEGVTVFGYRDTKDKGMRFSRMAVHFEVGRLRMVEAETPFLTRFRNEWIGFPNFHTDDTLDAVACAIDAAGINTYAGERVVRELDRPQRVESMPWGGNWGMPTSKFQGNR